MHAYLESWGGIHKTPKETLKPKGSFKCMFPNYVQLFVNKTLHHMQSFIEVVWLKIGKSAFEIFTQV